MKNVNFSPSARHRSSSKRSLRKKIIRYGVLISVILLIAVFWHRHVDMHQCRLPLSNAPLSNAPQGKAPQKAVQLDFPDKGEQNTVRPLVEKPPSVQKGTAEEGAAQESTGQKNIAEEVARQQGAVQQGAAQESLVQQGTQGAVQQGAAQESLVQQGTQGAVQQGAAQKALVQQDTQGTHQGTVQQGQGTQQGTQGTVQQGAAQENASSAKISPKMEYVSPKREVSPSKAGEVSPQNEKMDRMKTATRVDKEYIDEGKGYYIKVYSSVIKDDAEKAGACLTKMKYSPLIVREPGFAVMRNVYVIPNSSKGIQETVDRLTRDGFSVYLQEDSEHLENQYTIRIGSCYYLESAKTLLKSLKHKGYSGNIVEEKTAVRFYSVFLGKYPHFEAALEEQRELNMKGFPNAAVTAVIRASDE
jgi:hypothetical protein